MTQIVSVEFLATNGFSLRQYPDGKYWVLLLDVYDYCLQANEELTRFTEDDGGWVEEVSPEAFVEKVLKTNRFLSEEL